MKSIVIREDNPKQKTKETRFLLLAIEAKKVSLVGEFNNWNPETDPIKDGRDAEEKIQQNVIAAEKAASLEATRFEFRHQRAAPGIR